MDYKDKLEMIGALAGSGDELERDLALEMLREVYSEIKFGGIRKKVQAIPEPEPNLEFNLESTPDDTLVDETLSEGEDCQLPEIEESEHSVAEAPEPEHHPIARRRVAPEVIRSLYGSDTDEEEREVGREETFGAEPEPEAHAEQEQEQNPEDKQSAAEPDSEADKNPDTETVSRPATALPDNEADKDPDLTIAPETAPRHATTLGDAMAAGHRTLGETLAGAGGQRDLASKIAAAERPSLRRSIGLNDRFLMIRDMFDGEAETFDRAITQLDAFTDLDEAVIWMRSNFDWKADSKGVALLVGLLERKLGR